jgi:hypothetical protein
MPGQRGPVTELGGGGWQSTTFAGCGGGLDALEHATTAAIATRRAVRGA